MAITAKTLRLTKQLRADLLKITNEQDRALTGAWVDAWDVVSGDLETAVNELTANAQGGLLSRAMILRSRRLQYALQVIAQKLDQLTTDAGRLITDDLPGVVRAAGEAQEAIIASQLPKAKLPDLAGWVKPDANALDAIVKRSTEQITSELWPLSSEADAVIRRELVRGIATGSNPRATASRIMKSTEGGFNGGLSRALTIARTETISAHREAAAVSHQENADTLAGWRWLCALSDRSCPACLAKNGELHPVSEPGPQGHANCRCSRVPVTKSWRDLGIDLDEPADQFPDSREWFDAQSPADQLKIMGRQRLDLLNSGGVEWSDLATKKSNPDWRESWQVTPVKTLARMGAA